MPQASKHFVLDTSALFCLKEDEPGADEVEGIMREAGARGHAFISFITLMEFYYVLQQRQGESDARQGYLQLKQLPLQVVESDEELGLAAAAIKATNKLSVADAWIAATAERLSAVLVHRDPEYEQLKQRISLHSLPYKTKKTLEAREARKRLSELGGSEKRIYRIPRGKRRS